MLDNTVVIVGNLAAEPELRRLDTGAEVLNFRVGSTRRRYDRESARWVDGDTSWWRVSCWRGLALNAAESLHKGDRVVVVGRVRTTSWEKDDRSGTSVEVEAEAVGHDLAWGTSTFRRVVRSERIELPAQAAGTAADADRERDAFAAEMGLRVDGDGVVLQEDQPAAV